MNTLAKIAIGAVVTGGVYAGYKYFSGLQKTSAELQTVSTMKIHKLGLDGLTIRVDVTLKNPTANSLKIKYPFVKLHYKDTLIGSSQVIDKDIQIPANGEAHVDQMMINIPIMGIFSVASGLITSLTTKQPVKVSCKTLSTIDLGWKKIPYEKDQEQTLKS